MAIIIFDTKTRRFSVTKDEESRDLNGISREVCHNLIRLLLYPTSSSYNHWINETYALMTTSLTQRSTVKRRPIEELFNDIGMHCDSSRKFSLDKTALGIRVAKYQSESVYGIPRELSINLIAYGLWIYYKSLDPMKKIYSDEELVALLRDWFNIIKESPSTWSTLTDVTYKDVKLSTKYKRYLFQFNF